MIEGFDLRESSSMASVYRPQSDPIGSGSFPGDACLCIDRFGFPGVRVGRAFAHDAAGAVDHHRAVVVDLVRPRTGRVERARIGVLALCRAFGCEFEFERARHLKLHARIANVAFLAGFVERPRNAIRVSGCCA